MANNRFRRKINKLQEKKRLELPMTMEELQLLSDFELLKKTKQLAIKNGIRNTHFQVRSIDGYWNMDEAVR